MKVDPTGDRRPTTDPMTPSERYPNSPPIETQEPTRDGLKAALEEYPLIRQPNMLRGEHCKRCEEKNDVRRRYDIPEDDPNFMDGHRVRLFVNYEPGLEPEERRGWVVTAAYHLDHPMKAKDEVTAPGVVQAQVTARLDREGWTYRYPLLDTEDHRDEKFVEDRSVVRDVEIEWFSPSGEGAERPPIREPDPETGMVELRPTDPLPWWPEAENEWREKLMREHDDWNDGIPTVECL